MHTLRVTTYNIHKGMSFLNRRLIIHELRERLRTLHPDVVFLQEVHGANDQHAARFHDWPAAPQYEFLADTVWSEYAYGKRRHRGPPRNAIFAFSHPARDKDV